MSTIKEVTGADLRWNVLTAGYQHSGSSSLIVLIYLGWRDRDGKLTGAELRRYPMPMQWRLSVQPLREFRYASIFFNTQGLSQMSTPVWEKGDAAKIQHHLTMQHQGRNQDAIEGQGDQL
jgi:hypothetical protein